MKVLFVSRGTSSFSGGMSPIVKTQGESLKQSGMDLQFFRIQGRGPQAYVTGIFNLRMKLKSTHVDIIHAHYGLSGIVALLARRKEKLVISFMGDDLLGSVGRKRKYSVRSRILVSVNTWLAKHKYDHVIVKSPIMKEALPALDHVNVIPNGVHFGKFYPIRKDAARSHLNLDPHSKLVLFVANPNRPEKNYSLAKSAFEKLNMAKSELMVAHSIPHDELVYHYNASDVLLLTSLHEGSPNVIKEAMACNCPIVATDVGDVRAVIGNTHGCYVVSFEPDEVAEKLRICLERGQRTKGRDAIKHLEISTIASEIYQLYQQLLRQ